MHSKAYRKASKTIYLLFLVWLFPLAPAALAQAVYGSIFGTITDNTGALVLNATITVTDVSKGHRSPSKPTPVVDTWSNT